MSFPVTIDASVGGAEQPAKFATFFNSPNRYQIQFVLDRDAFTAQLIVYKSADSGATWDPVGDGPTAAWNGDGSTVTYTCVQVDELIYVIYIDEDLSEYAISTFDMSSDSWSGVLGSTDALSVFPISGEGGYTLCQLCASYRSTTNDILCVLPGSGVNLNDVDHQISCFAIFDIASSAWSDAVDLSYEDYGDITTWDLVPCGIVAADNGVSTVLLQQVARAGPGNLVTVEFDFSGDNDVYIPLDAPGEINVEAWGAGGGGNAGDDVGSGGGGGAYQSGIAAVTPGTDYIVHVGLGGASGEDGEASSFLGDGTVSASPGLAGSAGALAPGGSGGGGTQPGGDGGTTGGDDDGTTGGGGGGAGDAAEAGGDGQPGAATTGGAGGTSTIASGGSGGNGSIFNPPTGGQPGASPGGGGGGHGVADISTPGGNNGGDGKVILSWTSVRNTHDCRMYQQAINPDNTLGALTEITQGAYPSRAKNAAPVPLTCDIATFGGDVWITFTGATSTSGRHSISVGTGATADPISFSFQTFSSGNGGNNIDSCPALAVGAAAAYCCYISAPTAGPISFLYRADPGLGFGDPVSIGTLTLPDDREFGRLQASVLDAGPEITFGTPTVASLVISSPD